MSTSLYGSVIEKAQGEKQRWSYQVLQHDGAKACIQTRTQIPSQIRKVDNLHCQSANKRIQRTLDAPLILGVISVQNHKKTGDENEV